MKLETLYKVLQAVHWNGIRRGLREGYTLGVSEEVRREMDKIVPEYRGIKEIGKETGTSRKISQIMEMLYRKGIIIYITENRKKIPILTNYGENIKFVLSEYLEVKKRERLYVWITREDRKIIERWKAIEERLGIEITEDDKDMIIKGAVK